MGGSMWSAAWSVVPMMNSGPSAGASRCSASSWTATMRRASASSATPGLGQPCPAAVRFDQRLAQRLLQAADVLAHGGLAELKVRGGAVEASGVGDGDQAAQRNDVEHA